MLRATKVLLLISGIIVFLAAAPPSNTTWQVYRGETQIGTAQMTFNPTGDGTAQTYGKNPDGTYTNGQTPPHIVTFTNNGDGTWSWVKTENGTVIDSGTLKNGTSPVY